MKTANEILKEIETLKTSGQTLQPRAVLGLVEDLARIVAESQRNEPGRDRTDEL